MLTSIIQKIEKDQRITPDEALLLSKKADILTLGKLARDRSQKINGKRVAFLIDRNINYTNVCSVRCAFCAFYRPEHHPESYDLNFDKIDHKIKETLQLGCTRILLQGGLHPQHSIASYEKLISHIHETHPIHIHAFSPVEIDYVARKENLSYKEVILRLRKAGLASIPGGGAEILVDRVRDRISPGKCNSQNWLDVMKAAHDCGLKSTATMMMGHIETWEERIEHLHKLRELQDQTKGFLSFIPWTFQPENTALNPQIKRNRDVKLAGAYEYLRFLSLARLFLDNFDHIQCSLLTQGIKVSQLGIHFGADDLGSFLIEENVVRLAGRNQEVDLEKKKMHQIIQDVGYTAYERDTFYNDIGKNEKVESKCQVSRHR